MSANLSITIGDKYWKLTVIAYNGKVKAGNEWLCLCECGAQTLAVTGALRSGKKKSCGCLHIIHRLTNAPEYRVWIDARRRCYDPKNASFKFYGAEGITMAAEWRNNFAAFYAYLGPRPSSKHSLDRWPNQKGNYEPGNVRWATIFQQNRNKRDNVYLTWGGETHVVHEWAKRIGAKADTLYCRVKNGWTDQQTLLIPRRGRRKDFPQF